jgi:hypothetical protein
MNSSQCEYCGHVNRAAAAEVCEACEFPLGDDGAARADGPTSRPFEQGAPADYIPAPPFKRAGDVVSPMLAVYRKHFTLVGVLMLAATMPEALIRYGVVDFRRAGAALAGAGIDLTTMQGWLLWLLSLAVMSLLSSSLIYAVVDLQRTGSASAVECLSRALSVWPRVFLLIVLYSIIIIVGYLLLIVPGVILGLMFTVCVPAAVVEGRGPIDALKRSCELTKGYKGLIFITTFLWGLLIIVLNWVVIWSFARGGNLGLLPSLLLQAAVLGMLNSSMYVLNIYVYLGLLRERRSGFQTGAFTHGADAAAG